ncbi:MAG: ribosome small subunit-dependent GTPase A [Paracoccaceae bacterium]
MTPEQNYLSTMGWNAFFQSQIETDEFETSSARRVSHVHKNAILTIGEGGATRLPISGAMAAHGIAVGDWIMVDDASGAPGRVLRRQTVLKRGAAGDQPSAQLIAANVDTLFIVSSCNADFNIARLERYLALARQAQIAAVIVLTKADLCEQAADFRRRAEQALRGVLVECVDATGAAVAALLAPWCSDGRSVALLGSSGVGKTTLINALTGAGGLTRAIREDDARGRHTTTARALYETTTGGWVIDTPGMRSLRLSDVAEGVAAVFADIAELAKQCRFGDCAHGSEPGCAVQSAIGAGDLEAARLARWQKLQREDERHSETLARGRARSRDLEKTYKAGRARGKAKKPPF